MKRPVANRFVAILVFLAIVAGGGWLSYRAGAASFAGDLLGGAAVLLLEAVIVVAIVVIVAAKMEGRRRAQPEAARVPTEYVSAK